MSSNLYNNSDQNFKTEIDDEEGANVDASIFTGAIYRIYAQDGLSVLVEETLSGGGIVVVADTDSGGSPINVFKTSLEKIDMTMVAGNYTHQFKVVNSATQELPPLFQNTVNILDVLD